MNLQIFFIKQLHYHQLKFSFLPLLRVPVCNPPSLNVYTLHRIFRRLAEVIVQPLET